jgi:hypothetical protein
MLQVGTDSFFSKRQPESILCKTCAVLRPYREIVSIGRKLLLKCLNKILILEKKY